MDGEREFGVKITTSADLTAAREANKEIGKTAKEVSEVKQALEAEARAANEAAHATEEQVKSLDKAAIVASVVTATIAGLTKAIREFSDSEETVASLDAALAQQGLLVQQVREQYQGLASDIGKATAIADDEWLKVLTTLTKFGVMPEQINETAEAVKNLAGFMGGDLQSAASTVGRAVRGRTEALSRMGITVDETKSKSEQLESIFQQLAQRGGGQLEARANTLKGHWDALTNSVGDLFKGMGNLVGQSGALQFGLHVLQTDIEGLANLFPQFIGQNEQLKNKSADAAKALLDEADAQARLSKEAKEATNQLERQNRATDRAARRGLRKYDAKVQEELANIDVDEAAGALSPEEAALKRTQVRGRAERSHLMTEGAGLLTKRSLITKALAAPGLTPEQRATLLEQLDEVNTDYDVNVAKQHAAQTTGAAQEAVARARIQDVRRKKAEADAKMYFQQYQDFRAGKLRGEDLGKGGQLDYSAMQDLTTAQVMTTELLKQIFTASISHDEQVQEVLYEVRDKIRLLGQQMSDLSSSV